ncbi:PAQR family membrane homeostasis protein TrhA [Stenoxybacter acetivorans]|uniref:PAQR family membrane homeostasis protein TrhA n=1 Tax=Stenoxybacter acetivorans TaxID=422441 RepID=UPI000567EE1E|nr:hemolysin III family protein [Stenoxybacter acetivorans]
MYYSERFNAYSHLIGVCLAVLGTVLLVVKSVSIGSASLIVSFAVYGASLIVLYGISTAYHCVRREHAKAVLQKFDHCAIYVLIAGSYTPFTLNTLPGAWGWSLFGASWGLALFGIVQEITLGKKTRLLSMILYVVMGWLIVAAISPLVQHLPAGGLFWLVFGGLAYSIGIYWFLNDEKIRHGHGIWHLFVLAGSAAQFMSVYFYVR